MAIETAGDAFLLFRRELELNQEKFQKGNVRLCWEVNAEGLRHWVTELSKTSKVEESFDAGADCFIYLSQSELVRIINGERNIQDAFLDGTVRLSGSSKAALWLTVLIEHVTNIQ